MTRLVQGVAIGLLFAVAGACGEEGSPPLEDSTAAVRAALESGDPVFADAALDALADDVARARASGALTGDELAEAERLVTQARTLLDRVLPTTTTTTTTTTTSTTAATAPPEEDDEDDEDEPGKRKGRKGDD